MRTFPDFTWEWIIQGFEAGRKYWQKIVDTDPLATVPKAQVELANRMLDVLPKLSEHRQLNKLVPMHALGALRWFPRENCEIGLIYDRNISELVVFVACDENTEDETSSNSDTERKVVTVDNAADKIYNLITQLRDD